MGESDEFRIGVNSLSADDTDARLFITNESSE